MKSLFDKLASQPDRPLLNRLGLGARPLPRNLGRAVTERSRLGRFIKRMSRNSKQGLTENWSGTSHVVFGSVWAGVFVYAIGTALTPPEIEDVNASAYAQAETALELEGYREGAAPSSDSLPSIEAMIAPVSDQADLAAAVGAEPIPEAVAAPVPEPMQEMPVIVTADAGAGSQPNSIFSEAELRLSDGEAAQPESVKFAAPPPREATQEAVAAEADEEAEAFASKPWSQQAAENAALIVEEAMAQASPATGQPEPAAPPQEKADIAAAEPVVEERSQVPPQIPEPVTPPVMEEVPPPVVRIVERKPVAVESKPVAPVQSPVPPAVAVEKVRPQEPPATAVPVARVTAEAPQRRTSTLISEVTALYVKGAGSEAIGLVESAIQDGSVSASELGAAESLRRNLRQLKVLYADVRDAARAGDVEGMQRSARLFDLAESLAFPGVQSVYSQRIRQVVSAATTQ